MKDASPEAIVALATELKTKVSCHLSSDLNQSQLVVDIADSYEACRNFVEILNAFLSKEKPNSGELESFLVEVDVHLLEHLTYHLDSLRKLIPDALNWLAENDKKAD